MVPGMQTIDAMRRRAIAFIRRGGLSPKELAAQTGLTPQAFRHAVRDTWSPRADTLDRILAIIPPDFDPDATSGDPQARRAA